MTLVCGACYADDQNAQLSLQLTMQLTGYKLMKRENEAGQGRHGGQRFKKTSAWAKWTQ